MLVAQLAPRQCFLPGSKATHSRKLLLCSLGKARLQMLIVDELPFRSRCNPGVGCLFNCLSQTANRLHGLDTDVVLLFSAVASPSGFFQQ